MECKDLELINWQNMSKVVCIGIRRMYRNSYNVLRSNLRQHEKRSRMLSRSLGVIIALTKNSGPGITISGNSVQKDALYTKNSTEFSPRGHEVGRNIESSNHKSAVTSVTVFLE